MWSSPMVKVMSSSACRVRCIGEITCVYKRPKLLRVIWGSYVTVLDRYTTSPKHKSGSFIDLQPGKTSDCFCSITELGTLIPILFYRILGLACMCSHARLKLEVVSMGCIAIFKKFIGEIWAKLFFFDGIEVFPTKAFMLGNVVEGVQATVLFMQLLARKETGLAFIDRPPQHQYLLHACKAEMSFFLCYR